MELGWSALTLLCLAGLIAWFWQDSLAARESANAAAMEACRRLGLQFLDGTAAFVRLSPARESGRLKLRRTYVFDYTANSIERRQGFVVLIGSRVESVGYAPDGISPGNPPAQGPQTYGQADTERRFVRDTAFGGDPPETGAPHPPGHPAIEFRAQFRGPSLGPGGGSASAPLADAPRDAPEPGKDAAPQRHAAAADGTSNVLDLARWRARNRPSTPAEPLNREDRRH